MKDCSKSLLIHIAIISDLINNKRKSYKGYVVLRKGKEFDYKPSSKQRNMTKFYKS